MRQQRNTVGMILSIVVENDDFKIMGRRGLTEQMSACN